MVFTFEYIVVVYLYFLIACALSFGIGAMLLMTAMCKDIRNNLTPINDRVRERKNHLSIVKQFKCTIQFHSAVKQLRFCTIFNISIYFMSSFAMVIVS